MFLRFAWKKYSLAVTCVLLLGAAPLTQASQSKQTLTVEQQHDIVQSFNQQLQNYYVRPAKKQTITVELSKLTKLSADGPMTQASFLSMINQHIQTVSNDKHLRIMSPEKYRQIRAMFYSESPSEEQAQDQSSNHHSRQSGSNSTEGSGLSAIGVSNVAEISRDGLNQTGYLALERFDASDRSFAFLRRVFATFTESDNIIIDLRKCGGGDGELVNELSSYFFNEPTHLLTTEMPNEDYSAKEKIKRWTTPNSLSKFFTDKPVTILISNATFSAAESFAFGMQASGRATLVGEPTGGGGYTNDFFDLDHDFGASISVGRTYDHRTGNDWQGIGVIPEVEIEQDHALFKALSDFTARSGKLDKIQGEDKEIYQQVQAFTEAWYKARPEIMDTLLSQDYIRIYKSPGDSPPHTISRVELMEETAKGSGTRKNPIFYNRIIKDIQINGNRANVTLILRETLHQLTLVKSADTWKISRDQFSNKRHG